jgi:hypothetical protein
MVGITFDSYRNYKTGFEFYDDGLGDAFLEVDFVHFRGERLGAANQKRTGNAL